MPRLKYPVPRMTSVRELADLALIGADHRDWYTRANAEVSMCVQALREQNVRISEEDFAALLALFSPRLSVLRSAKMTVHYVRTWEFPGDCMSSTRAAVKHWKLTGTIRGPKTEPFRRAILGDLSAIVIDTWMCKALGFDGKRAEVKTVWNRAAKKISSTARYLGWTNAETQAAIWAGEIRKQEYGRVATFDLMSLVDDSLPI